MPRKPKKLPKVLYYGVRPAPKVSIYITYTLGLNSSTWANSEIWASVISSNVAAIHFYKRLGYYKPSTFLSKYSQKDIYQDTIPTSAQTRGEGQLFVLFNSGIIYRYDNIPQSVAENMYNCNSLGSFIHQKLKGKYVTNIVK